MKLDMNVNSPTTDNSYTHVGLKRNIDSYSDRYECDEIYSLDILNYINASKLENFIEHLISKLNKGGRLRLGGFDYIELSKMAIRQDFNVIEYNRLVYGLSEERPKESAITLNFIMDIINKFNMKVLMKRLNGYDFFIEAVKQ